MAVDDPAEEEEDDIFSSTIDVSVSLNPYEKGAFFSSFYSWGQTRVCLCFLALHI